MDIARQHFWATSVAFWASDCMITCPDPRSMIASSILKQKLPFNVGNRATVCHVHVGADCLSTKSLAVKWPGLPCRPLRCNAVN
jgi:hypothetical protein